MNILVIGGAGYIGSHTVLALKKKGYNPIIFDNFVTGHRDIAEKLDVNIIEGNIRDEILLKDVIDGKNKNINNGVIDGIIHFAAFSNIRESFKEPIKYYENNIFGTINVIKTIINSKRNLKKPIPFVFSSSCATYGIPSQLPIKENHIQEPINPYGFSKLAIERFMKDISLLGNFNSIIFRYFNASGADKSGLIGEKNYPPTHLIPIIINSIINETKINIFGDDYDTSDGTCERDYIHVDDLAEAHIMGLEKLFNTRKCYEPFIYNLGTGIGYSVLEIINAIESVTNKKVKYLIKSRRPGDPASLICDPTKAKTNLNWTPKYSEINTIIKDAWNWHLSN